MLPRRAPSVALLLAAAATLAACADAAEPELTDDWAEGGGDCEGGKCDAVSAVSAVSEPSLLINDPVVLAQLAGSGFGLARATGGDASTNAALAASSTRFTALASTITGDLAEFKAADRQAGVGLAFSHRQFDGSWLRSSKAFFKLVAVVNRLDLAHRTPSACGEVRFIYRLAYTTAQGTSRLPMTINAVYEQPTIGGSCAPVAKAWQDAGGRLAALQTMLAPYRQPARLEVNLQAVRWPAVTRADMGGYAEYLMRVFTVTGATVVAQTLPDTIRTDLSAAQKTALATWIKTNAAGIDRGTANVPAEFPREARDLGVAARARPRREPAVPGRVPAAGADVRQRELRGPLDREVAGRPRAQARHDELQRVPPEPRARGLSPARRGDGGRVARECDPGGELAAAERGAAVAQARARGCRGRAPDQQGAAVRGAVGARRPVRTAAHCGLAGDPSFDAWTCASGYTCKDLSGDEIGMCVASGEPGAGDTCETSTVSFDANPQADHVTEFETQQCGVMPTGRRAYCNHSGTKPFTTSSFGGFPNGSCSSPCLTMGKLKGAAICGAQPPDGFNDCLGKGTSFSECLANATPELRRRCDSKTPCGDDYVCAGVAGAARASARACRRTSSSRSASTATPSADGDVPTVTAPSPGPPPSRG